MHWQVFNGSATPEQTSGGNGVFWHLIKQSSLPSGIYTVTHFAIVVVESDKNMIFAVASVGSLAYLLVAVVI